MQTQSRPQQKCVNVQIPIPILVYTVHMWKIQIRDSDLSAIQHEIL